MEKFHRPDAAPANVPQYVVTVPLMTANFPLPPPPEKLPSTTPPAYVPVNVSAGLVVLKLSALLAVV